LMRLKTIPVVVGFPFGLSVGGFPPLLPLPAKVTMELLEPVDLGSRYGADPDVEELQRPHGHDAENLHRAATRAPPARARMRIEEAIEADAAPGRVWKLIQDPAALTGLNDGLAVESDPETPKGRGRSTAQRKMA
jgi:hypothetical protein